MTRFSIVVPAYNAEQFINQCLSSLENQTFCDFEVVCVDDASTDDTATVIEQFAARDRRFNLIRNDENMKQFAARHIGVAQTTGEYIAFLDADDEFTIDALEKLDAHLKKRPVDILQFEMQIETDDAEVEVHADAWYSKKYEAAYFEGEEIIRAICMDRPDDVCVSHRVFNGDLVRDVFEGLGVVKGLYAGEDLAELMALMVLAESYEIINSAEYYIYHLGRGVNGSEGTVSLEQFEKHSLSKWMSFKTLCGFLDKRDLHSCAIDEALDFRWAYACMQTLWYWNVSLEPKNHKEAMLGLAELWPLDWLLPETLLFIANDAEFLLACDESSYEEVDDTIDRLAANIDSVGVLYGFGLSNSSEPSILASDDAASLFSISETIRNLSDSIENRQLFNYMLKYCSLFALYHRATYSSMAQVRWFQAREERLERALHELVNSKTYKLGNTLAKPIRVVKGAIKKKA